MYKIIEARRRRECDAGVRQTKWEELVCVMEHLEEAHGWREVDGTEVYTKDRHKSRVLGKPPLVQITDDPRRGIQVVLTHA
jgi:hypothetical protein